MSEVSVTLGAGNTMIVSGLLDVNSVGKCRDAGREFIAGGAAQVDLSDAQVKGSAVIALLIDWQREARALSRELVFKGASEELLRIAQICGVQGMVRLQSGRE